MASEGLSFDDIARLKVADLKDQLSARNLSTKGLKKELADRLIEAISGNADSTALAADPAATSSGDAPSMADEILKQTDNLPSELPAVPPATENTTDADTIGKDAMLSEEAAATTSVAVSAGPSEVVKPSVGSIDKTSGVVGDSRERQLPKVQNTEPYENGSGEKRKREDELEKVNDSTAIHSVAVQEETTAANSDEIQQNLAVDDVPQIKRSKTDVEDTTGTESEGNFKLDASNEQPTELESRSRTANSRSELRGGHEATLVSAKPISQPNLSGNAGGPSALRSVNIRGSSGKVPRSEALSTRAANAADAATHSHEMQSENDGPSPSTSLCVSNLVRPFTLPALKEKLEEHGAYSYFWINSVKSHCYVTYDTLDASRKAKQAMTGEVWPESTGKSLSLVYLPDERVTTLVQQEETSGRARLELVTTLIPDSNEWQFDLRPPSNLPPGQRSLASQPPPRVPTAAQADVYRGQTFSNPLLTGQGLRNGAADRVYNDRQRDTGVWQPTRGGESYLTTKTQPSLHYREADKTAVDRRSREPLRKGFKTYRPNYR